MGGIHEDTTVNAAIMCPSVCVSSVNKASTCGQ